MASLLTKTGFILPGKVDKICDESGTENSIGLIPVAMADYKEKKRLLAICADVNNHNQPSVEVDVESFNSYSLS